MKMIIIPLVIITIETTRAAGICESRISRYLLDQLEYERCKYKGRAKAFPPKEQRRVYALIAPARVFISRQTRDFSPWPFIDSAQHRFPPRCRKPNKRKPLHFPRVSVCVARACVANKRERARNVVHRRRSKRGFEEIETRGLLFPFRSTSIIHLLGMN